MAIRLQSETTGNLYEDVINKVHNRLRELTLRLDTELAASVALSATPTTADQITQLPGGDPAVLSINPVSSSTATVTIVGMDEQRNRITESVTFTDDSEKTTRRAFSEITEITSDAPVTVSITAIYNRMTSLSHVVVSNIELAPVVIDRIQNVLAPSIYLSVDSSQSANDLQGELQAFIELLNIRIELYLGRDNDNLRLTTKAANLLDDFRQVLSPTKFIGSPLTAYGQTLASEGRYKAEIQSLLDLPRRIRMLHDGLTTQLKENPEFDTFYQAFMLPDTNYQLSSFPLPEGAKIMDAGILQWGFDERTRGTADEILVFIFSVELHHYVEGATFTVTTD